MGNKQIKKKVKILQQELNEVDADGDIPKIKISGLASIGDEYLLELLPAARGKRVKHVSLSKSVISSSLLLVLSELVVTDSVYINRSFAPDADCRKDLGRWISELPSDGEIYLSTDSPNEDLILDNLVDATCSLHLRPAELGLKKDYKVRSLKLGKIIMVGNLCELEVNGKLFNNKRQERVLLNSLEMATPSLKRIKFDCVEGPGAWKIGEYQENNFFYLTIYDLCKRDASKILGLKLPPSIEYVDINAIRLSKTEKTAHLLAILLERSSVAIVSTHAKGHCVITPAVTLASRLWEEALKPGFFRKV